MRPVRRSRDQLGEIAHHLAAVANAECERVATREKRREFVAGPRIEQNRLGPAFTGAQYIAIGKTSAGDDTAEIGERPAAGEDIGHVNVDSGETRAIERRGHLDLTVDALLAQDRDLRARIRSDKRRGNVLPEIECQQG